MEWSTRMEVRNSPIQKQMGKIERCISDKGILYICDFLWTHDKDMQSDISRVIFSHHYFEVINLKFQNQDLVSIQPQ